MRPYRTASLTEQGLGVLDSLPFHSEEKKLLSWIKNHPEKRLPWRLQEVYPLQKRGWLIIEERTKKGRTGPLMRRFVRPKGDIDLECILAARNKSSKAKNEVEFLETIFGSDAMLLSELTAKFSNGAYLVKKWNKKGVRFISSSRQKKENQ